MAIVQRRVLVGKVGTGNELIEHLKKGNEYLTSSAINVKTRVLSDHNSGRTDRVVAEWEIEDVGELEVAMDQAMEDPRVQAAFGPWVARLNELIHYAEVENWHIH